VAKFLNLPTERLPVASIQFALDIFFSAQFRAQGVHFA